MNFFNSNLTTNNLGGFGPDNNKEPVLLYENVGSYNGRQMDMEVKVHPDGAYRPNNAANINGYGSKKNFGEINLGGRQDVDVLPGTNKNEARFIFQLVDHVNHSHGLNTSVTVGKFSFAYFDFDAEPWARSGFECLTVKFAAPADQTSESPRGRSMKRSRDIPTVAVTRHPIRWRRRTSAPRSSGALVPIQHPNSARPNTERRMTIQKIRPTSIPTRRCVVVLSTSRFTTRRTWTCRTRCGCRIVQIPDPPRRNMTLSNLLSCILG